MLKHLTLDQLIQIARNGGSLEIPGGQFTADDVIQLARNMTEGAILRIHSCNVFTSEQLVQIARNKCGQVIFA
ncbi:MAG: hypothetical protein ABSC37_19790 [Xanthobacteraceae bacterium]